MGAIEEIYADLEADVTEEEFRDAVEAKVEQMAGLADEETAAMLVAHELADQTVHGIADIAPGMEEVKFLGKVVSVGELREFERDGEDDSGRVVNVELADETGRIRAAFWDEHAEAAVDELEPGQVLRVMGRPKDGYNGVEVSVDRVEPDDEAEIDVTIKDEYDVEDLSLGLSDVNLRGRVLAVDPVRTFSRDDDTEGRVANIALGDETGRIRVTLWDEKADLVETLAPGESVEVIDGYVRDRDGQLELHVGNRGAIEPIDASIDYQPASTDIDDLEIGDTVDLAGVITTADPVRTFDRDDGSQGQVRNVRLRDGTGEVRVALWGDHADLDIGPGDEVTFTDVEIKEGWQEDLEASAGWRTAVIVLEDDVGLDAPPTDPADEPADDVGLDAFSGGSTGAGEGASAEDAGDEVTFTGVVVQVGDPVVLDDGSETLRVATGSDLQLGQEVTVSGRRRADGRVEADTVEVG